MPIIVNQAANGCLVEIVNVTQARAITGDETITDADLDAALDDLVEWARWDPCDNTSRWSGYSYPTRCLRRAIAFQASFRLKLAAADAGETGRLLASESIGEYSRSFDNTGTLSEPGASSTSPTISRRAAQAWNAGGFSNRSGYSSAVANSSGDDNMIEVV